MNSIVRSDSVFPPRGLLDIFNRHINDDFLYPSDFFKKLNLDGFFDFGKSSYPKLDIYSNEKELIYELSVPGVKKEDLTVELLPETDEYLSRAVRISGQISQEYRNSNNRTHVKELHKSKFSRTINIPSEVEDKEPVISLKDGILRLVFELKKNSVKEIPKSKKLEIT